MVAVLKFCYAGTHLFHDPGKLMTEGHTDTRVGNQTVIKMQVRTADTGTGHANVSVIGMKYLWITAVFIDADAKRSAIMHGYHRETCFLSVLLKCAFFLRFSCERHASGFRSCSSSSVP